MFFRLQISKLARSTLVIFCVIIISLYCRNNFCFSKQLKYQAISIIFFIAVLIDQKKYAYFQSRKKPKQQT